jgi:Polysaccharide lyase
MRAMTLAALINSFQQARSQGAGDFLHIPARLNRMRGRVLMLIAGALLVQSAYPETASILSDSYETGTIQSSIWNRAGTGGCTASIETGDAADGTRYMRSSLTANPPTGGNYRCEWNARGIDMAAKLGVTYYYGIAFRVPSDFAYDSQSDDTIMQLMHRPLKTELAPKSSHHAIRIKDRNLGWMSHLAGGPNADLGPLVRGEWTRACVRAKWTTDNTGSLNVWVNASSESSTPAFKWSGQTVPADYTNLGKFKVGIYKPRWRSVNFPTPFNPATSPRIVEHDDIRVGLSFAEACARASDQSEPPISIPKPPISVAVE